MEIYDWSMIVGMIAIISFLWKLSQDMQKLESSLTTEMRDLGERFAKIEGAIYHGVIFKEGNPTVIFPDNPL